ASRNTEAAERHFIGTAKWGVLQSPIDLRLDQSRFVPFRAATSGEEVKLMAIAAGPVDGAGVAGIEPERNAVGTARPAGVSPGRLVLAFDLDLQTDTEIIPGQADIGEVAPLVHAGKVIHPAFFRQVEQAIDLFAGDTL